MPSFKDQRKKYNILFIMPDQLRADFIGCYEAKVAQTPAIDQLCERGVRYQRAVSPSPLCVPARASLLTGLNAITNGVLDNNHWFRPDRRELGISSWPEDVAGLGYHTEAIGKMHFYPWDAMEGFNHRIIAEDKRHIGIQDDYADYLAHHGLRRYHGKEHDGYFENQGAIFSKIPTEHQIDRWVANQTCNFLRQYRSDKPFALMVGFPGPHCPYDPPREYAEMFAPKDMPRAIPPTPESRAFRQSVIESNKRTWNQVDYSQFDEERKAQIRSHYAAMVKQIDDCVGQIVATLKEQGLFEQTVIIFASDHGDFLGDFDLIGKQYFFEPAIRVPLIVSHPRSSQGTVSDSVVSLTDVTATIRQLAGMNVVSTNDSMPLPGLPEIHGARRTHVVGATAKGYMITTDEWKLCRYHNGTISLINLIDDPLEQRNLIAEAPCADLSQLDAVLQQEIWEAVQAAHFDKRVMPEELDASSPYCRRGWYRPFPMPFSTA